MLQNRTSKGSTEPCSARRSAQRPRPAGRLQYSTQSLISSAVPVPALVQMYGSAPIARHQATNSAVPNVFGSVTRQARS